MNNNLFDVIYCDCFKFPSAGLEDRHVSEGPPRLAQAGTRNLNSEPDSESESVEQLGGSLSDRASLPVSLWPG